MYKSKRLLNIDNNAKTIKGQKLKVKTAILYLAPANESGFNMCQWPALDVNQRVYSQRAGASLTM